MKYWIFENNQVLGPYEPEDLAKNSAFTADSLVCPEGRRGTNIGDWHRAGMIPELAGSVGRPTPAATNPPAPVSAVRRDAPPPAETLVKDASQILSLQEKMSSLEQVVQKLQTGLKTKDSELAALNQALGQKEQESAKVKREAEATKQLAEKFKLSTEELKVKLASMEGRLAGVLRLNETIDKALAAEKQVENNIASHGETLADLTREIESLKSEMRSRSAPRSDQPPVAPVPSAAQKASAPHPRPAAQEKPAQPAALYQPGSPEADMLSELTREIDSLKAQIQTGDNAGSLGVKPAEPMFSMPDAPPSAPVARPAPPPPIAPAAPAPAANAPAQPVNPPLPPPNSAVVEMISSTVQEAGRTAWPPVPPAPPRAEIGPVAPSFPNFPAEQHSRLSRAAQTLSNRKTRVTVFAALAMLTVFGVVLLVGPRAFKGSRPATALGDDAPVEVPVSTKASSGGSPTANEPDDSSLQAPVNEPARLAAISTARQHVLPTGRTLGQTLESISPPSGNLPPWMAELLTNGHYVVNFFSRGAAGAPTVAFEFEVDPGANSVVGRNSAAKSVLLGHPVAPPAVKSKAPVRVKPKGRAPSRHKAPTKVNQEESLDTLLGSVGVPTEQVMVESEKARSPATSPSENAGVRNAPPKRAARAATQPSASASGKASDEALLDDLLKE